MLEPATIDPLVLPSVPLSERSQLPTTPCIYFAIDSQGVIQYIGKTKNLRERWESHHKGVDLALLGGIRISYLSVEQNLLKEVESALIQWFSPPLNRIPKAVRIPKPAEVEKRLLRGGMKVRKIVEREFPGLGTRIRRAREADSRSLIQLCAGIDMTPANWYKIENEETKVLPIETLQKIEGVLGVDFGVTLEGEGDA